MRECICGKWFNDPSHASCRRCRHTRLISRQSQWAQEPDGFLTLDPIIARYGIHHTSLVFRCEMRTVQRMARRTYTIPQARAMADLFGVRVSELWPDLGPIDQQLGAVEWRELAACKGKDVDLFFPPSGTVATQMYERCRAICNGCPVQEECLREALFIEERRGEVPQGFVGGKTPAERKALLRFREDATRRRVGGAA